MSLEAVKKKTELDPLRCLPVRKEDFLLLLNLSFVIEMFFNVHFCLCSFGLFKYQKKHSSIKNCLCNMRMYQYKVIKCILHKNKLSLFFFIFVPKVLEKEFMLNQHIGCVIIGPFCFSKIFIFYAGFLYLLKQLDNIRNNYLL